MYIPEDPNNENEIPTSATVEFIGTVVLTLGYVIVAIAEGIALSELAQAKDKEEQGAKLVNQTSQDQKEQLSDIQSKLDYLVNEIEMLKKKG
ncbi:hypothetical protein [Psychrobacillus sp. FJAT-21963]|uniref:hypothetical protein n=1 Tax=Psychrobacillus sp. FJAT-21963 TaxID=1712028 RepID=UPI000701C67C|nr:hypothetical protein [Psychrobacillus sp. FJAT-21963]KQL37446.1 hypothetical protein AN959_05395 [Psychrobacillus sp. FJAT-21963]